MYKSDWWLSKLLPHFNTVCEAHRCLTNCNSVFDILPQHDDAFCKVKERITKAPVLRYFDVDNEVTSECDSSDIELGAVPTQNGRPVA